MGANTVLTFSSVDNQIVIGSIFVVGTWCSVYLLRLVYLISDESTWMSVLPWFVRHLLPKLTLFPASFTFPPTITILVYGQRTTVALAVLYMALSCILFTRLTISMDLSSSAAYFDLDSFSKSYWCLVRLYTAGVVLLLTQNMHSHYALRVLACLLTPFLIIMDLLSELGLVVELQCVQNTSCYTQQSLITTLSSANELYFLTWRDCIAASVGLILTAFIFWQTAMWGWKSNEIRIPTLEQREYIHQLNKTREQQRKKAEEARKALQAKSEATVSNLFF